MTEGLRVVPDDLSAFASRMRILMEDVPPARKYVSEWLSLPSDANGLFGDTVGAVHAIRDRLQENYVQLESVAAGSATELRGTAAMYREIDLATAAELDRSYQSVEPPAVDEPSSGWFGLDGSSPSALLAEPQAERPLLTDLENTIVTLQFLSPSWIVLETVERGTGVDLLQWTERVLGSWEEVVQAASALRALGSYNDAFAQALRAANANSSRSWDGNAAAGAEAFFAVFADAVANQRAPLRKIADGLQSLATGVSEFATFLGDVVQTLCDIAIVAAVQFGMSFLPAPAGPAFRASYLVTLKAMAEIASEIIDHYGALYVLARGIFADMWLASGSVELRSLPALPARAYDHPGV